MKNNDISFNTSFGVITNVSEARSIEVHSKGNQVDTNAIPFRTVVLPDTKNPLEDVMYIYISDAELDGNPVELMYSMTETNGYDKETDQNVSCAMADPNDFLVLKSKTVENGLIHIKDNVYKLKEDSYFPNYILKGGNLINQYKEIYTSENPIIAKVPYDLCSL